MLGAVRYSGFNHNNRMSGMNWEMIGAVAEMLSGIAVVASVSNRISSAPKPNAIY